MKLRTLILVIVVYGILWAGIWSEPQYIGEGGGVNLTVDNHGVCWCECSNSFFTYNNVSKTWEHVTDVAWGGEPRFDKADTLWVMTVNYTEVYYTRYDGEQWLGPDTVPTYGYGFYAGVHITADSTDGVWVGWITIDVWYAFQTNYNRYKEGKWGEPCLLSDPKDGLDHAFYAMTTDALGRVWMAWHTSSDPDRITTLESVYWDGNAWSEPSVIIDMSDTLWGWGFPIYLHLAPDHEGGVWAFWNQENEQSIYVLASYSSGGGWSAPDTISLAGPFYGDSPYTMSPRGKMTVDKDDNIWAVWRQAVVEKDSLGDIYYSVNSGQGWSEPESVDVNPAFDFNPDIAVDGDGRVWCVWASNRDGEDKYDNSVWASYARASGVEETVTHQLPSFKVEPHIGKTFNFYVPSQVIPGKLEIYDACGRLVKQLTVRSDQTLFWDGTEDAGKRLSPGVYFVRFESHNNLMDKEKIIILH
ncbi:T9SS type A sorting domain-containing protein [candidate division WOR-3 bacterium]|nr:T9SS type A sorting domain-containing protein [candidate division WOR-3 bacterium]